MQSGLVARMKPSLKSLRNGNLDLIAARSPSVIAELVVELGSGQACPWWASSSLRRASDCLTVERSSSGSKS
jgi:hypothetical protein